MALSRMKKLFTILALLVFLSTPAYAAKTVSFGTLIGGGISALDAIPCDDVNDNGVTDDPLETGDRAFGTHDGNYYVYVYDSTSVASENSPTIIVPDNREDCGGTGAWERAGTTGDTIDQITYVINGGGSVITSGVHHGLPIVFDCTITGWRFNADQSTSTVVDVWKDTEANYPPVDADSITASAPPTLSTASVGSSETLTGWTTAISAGDYLVFNVDSNDNATYLTITLEVLR